MNRATFGLLIIMIVAILLWVGIKDRTEQETAPVATTTVDTKNEKPENSPPLGRLSANVTPQHYTLELTLIPDADHYKGSVSIDVTIDQPVQYIWLHGQNLSVTAASFESGDQTLEVSYQQVHDSGVAKVSLPQPVSGNGRLHLQYSAPFSTSLDAIYKVKESGNAYLFSQMEAISARMALPCFDEPRFKTPFDVSVIAPENLNVITNTPETGSVPVTEGLTRHNFATTKPLPTYLLAFAVGDFDIVEWDPIPPSALRNRPLPLRGVAVKGKGEKLRYALENTRPIVEALENYFGVAYPYAKLDILAAPDFAFGAMENAGAIVYREQLLLLDENAPLTQKRNYGVVHAHELAHQWFGNLVTPKWWNDIWLNEAFATWMSYKAVQEWNPQFEYSRELLAIAQQAMSVDARASARQIRQPIVSNDDIMNAFDSITYRKGGGVLQMFESFLGRDDFRKGVQLHMQRFGFAAADVHDFMQSLAEGSGNADLIAAFESFLFQPGVAMLELTQTCEGEQARIDVRQFRYVPLGVVSGKPQQWQVPLCYKTDRKQACTLVTDAQQQLTLDHCPAYLMPNNNAAGYYHWNLDDANWRALLTHADALGAGEKISLVHNFQAAFRAGGLQPETLLRAFEVVANDDKWDVVTAPIGDLANLRHILLNDKPTQNYKAFVTALYQPHYQRLGLWPNTEADKRDSIGTALMRQKVVDALALEARDKDVRAQLQAMALAYLGYAQNSGADELHPQAANADLLPTALAVAVEESDAKFGEQLLSRALQSTDAIFRDNALGALVQSKDKKLSRHLVDELLLAENVRSNEAQRLIYLLMHNPNTQDYTWQWLKNNIDPFLKRFSSFSVNRVVSIAGYFCDPDSRSDVETFYKSVETKIAGAPRALAETLEVIDQCIALRATQTDVFTQALNLRSQLSEQ